MAEYNNMYVCHEARDGQYGLKSYWTSSQTVEFDDGQNLEEYKTEISQNIDTKGDTIGYSLDDGEVFLYSDDNKIATETMQLKTSPNVTLDDISNLSIRLSKGKIRFTWRDPSDVVFSELPLITWAGTKVIRKIGSAPNDVTDGTLVIDSKDRDTYSSTPYFDEPSTNNVYYYYRFFPYDTNGNYYGRTCGVIYKPIRLIPVDPPQLTETYTYTGQNITPNFTNYDTNFMTRGGTVYAKNAGDYSTTFTLKEGYKWSDDTIEPKTINWGIGKAEVSVPTVTSSLKYTGNSQQPTITGFDSSCMTKSGDTAAIDVGSYTVTISLSDTNNYKFNTTNNTSIDYNWSIGKGDGFIVLSSNNITISGNIGSTQTININSCSSEQISFSSFDENVVTVSKNNNVITLTGVSAGNTSIIINVAETNSYTSTSAVIEVYSEVVAPKNKWVNKTWYGLSSQALKSLSADHIWTDGEDVYYSYNTTYQYVLDKSTSTWSQKAWSGYSGITGEYVWEDGDNIYWSSYSSHYILDKTTSTWNKKTWNVSTFYGTNIWSDGENIYLSTGNNQYVLDKATSTWVAKTWNGFTKVEGRYVWSDGENIYYSNYGDQYVLNKATSTWIAKTWDGFRPDNPAYYLWSDGENIYYTKENGNNYTHYVLNKETLVWESKTWNGATNFRGQYIWTDGENIYASYGDGSVTRQYVLVSEDQ